MSHPSHDSLRVPTIPSVQASGMRVVVEDAAESVLSPDVEVVESVGIGDRLR